MPCVCVLVHAKHCNGLPEVKDPQRRRRRFFVLHTYMFFSFRFFLTFSLLAVFQLLKKYLEI